MHEQEICGKAVWIIAKGSNARPPQFDFLSGKFNHADSVEINHQQLFDEMVKWLGEYLRFPRVQKATTPIIQYSSTEGLMTKMANFSSTFGDRANNGLKFTPLEACFLQLGGMAGIENENGHILSCQEVMCRTIKNTSSPFRDILLSFYLYRKNCKTKRVWSSPVNFKSVKPRIVSLSRIYKKNKKTDDTVLRPIHVRTKKSFAAMVSSCLKSSRGWYNHYEDSDSPIPSTQLLQMYNVKKQSNIFKSACGKWAEWKSKDVLKQSRLRNSFMIYIYLNIYSKL